ncbi:tetratricopeptide repeat protein [Desulfocurvibacter africanus]|uniref:Tetratricopeptide TPR_2 repeat-containing protein n=1 Tax=Desulfocurvibacter africanus subsp. africanus str. Walvis Bay TaxID=690850 RepID=F3YXJ3_DESAF|nr:tetratricopeptide repeat protein [Desulfocurvibacter africanus]EGJ51770.1 Tetratricopeptide TPR_2 repeat-containing protein [Desulfocurvibacter africanus subsp. africanus str. Walvis Bay]
MPTLRIQQEADAASPTFSVIRLSDGKKSGPFAIVSPRGFPVEGRPNSDLMAELRWYLEEFLEYPFHPETDHAERVLDSLKQWGERAFVALFADRNSRRFFDDATEEGHEKLLLQVASDDPEVLSWPWEALKDPEAGVLAHHCQIERRINQIRDPAPLSKKLPKDQVNILLVTARPYTGDVAYRSLSRPLVELIEKHRLPAHVHVLRPPTVDRLREHLRERRDHYHILHFDGHGAFSCEPADNQHRHMLRGSEGRLIFEDAKGEACPLEAERLSDLLREYRIPAVVLNACQSGMLDVEAKDPFASVAAAFLKCGVRSVVAMAYSLYVSGGQQFLPAFYRRLFETGSVAEAARAGRQQMRANRDRVCVRGSFPLQDWLVPVLYQQDELDLSFAKAAKTRDRRHESKIPEEARLGDLPYDFIGRDGPILELERAMRGKAPAILIQGLGGVGKTTLAKGLLDWLEATEGLGHGASWFAFNDIRSAEFVINQIGMPLRGTDFCALGMQEKIKLLGQSLRDLACVIVWDNFEVVRGIPSGIGQAPLPAEDQGHLLAFLQALRGGRTKVLITSRSEEEWLPPELRIKIQLGGLWGEERWEFCNEILESLRKKINREDKDLKGLMDDLNGHPLAMRVILPRLETLSAGHIREALKRNLDDLKLSEDDPEQQRLLATLRFAQEAVPEELRPLLVPLALHERYVDANFLMAMARQVDSTWTRDKVDRLLDILSCAGLLRAIVQATYDIHPALTGFLRRVHIETVDQALDSWKKEFVNLMATLADHLVSRELHEQKASFHFNGSNMHYALLLAEELDVCLPHIPTLLQCLAIYSKNTRALHEASLLFERLAGLSTKTDETRYKSVAYHQLGAIAEEQRNYDQAEKWYLKSLEMDGKLGHEHGTAMNYGQLGNVALARRDLDQAENCYHRTRMIMERLGDESGAAIAYHQLGMVAELRGDLEEAENNYHKSLKIDERLSNKHGTAQTYHQLGMVAEKRGDLERAEKYYLKSLEIEERLGNERGVAGTYHQLGNIAYARQHFDQAEKFYRNSLMITEKTGDAYVAAQTYYQLGNVACDRRDFDQAEKWYRKTLIIMKQFGDEYGIAMAYGKFGIIAGINECYIDSINWLLKAINAFFSANDCQYALMSISNLLITYENIPKGRRHEVKELWIKAGLAKIGDLDELLEKRNQSA